MADARSQQEWLRRGIELGYCTPAFCMNHDGWAPGDGDYIQALWDEYEGDHCLPVVRLKEL